MIRDILIDFEETLAEEFNTGSIPYPIHLENGNEAALIKVFSDVNSSDWVFGSWRMHLKALLKGVPKDVLRNAIRRGESMALKFPDQRVYGSAIVGGTVPIALGTAMAIKRRGGNERVWCFMGDMTFKTGIAIECITYALNHELPIIFVVEDNGLSVCTDTCAVWGLKKRLAEPDDIVYDLGVVRFYQYNSKWPHAGAGVRVQF